MGLSRWLCRWSKTHPNASLEEYSDALCRRTVFTAAITYLHGIVAFIGIALLISFL